MPPLVRQQVLPLPLPQVLPQVRPQVLLPLAQPLPLAHPQVVARGMRVETGGIPMLATPMRFDGQRPVAPLAPPRLDEHGDAIRQALADQAGWPSP